MRGCVLEAGVAEQGALHERLVVAARASASSKLRALLRSAWMPQATRALAQWAATARAAAVTERAAVLEAALAESQQQARAQLVAQAQVFERRLEGLMKDDETTRDKMPTSQHYYAAR